MGTNGINEKLSSVLFGKTRRAVLALFYGNLGKSFYLRQVVRAVGMGLGVVQRELKQLTDAGIIIKTRNGRQVHYRANAECPIFPDLRNLVMKTVGLADVLREALEDISQSIKIAYIYGSFAAGSEGSKSDVDVMVIGSCSFGQVVEVLSKAQDKLGREINPTVYPVSEFKSKMIDGNHFIRTVLREPKIFLIGDEHELEDLA